MLSLLSAICASALGAVGCQQDQPTAVTAARLQQAAVSAPDTTLAPNADTHVDRSHPGTNYGRVWALLVGPGGERRALLRWDKAALAQAAAGGTVTAARLELTLLAERGEKGERAERGDQGGTIELHRLTHSWTETGATWSCSDEQHPIRGRPECPRSAGWVMGEPDSRQPWVSAATATARPGAAQRGVVTLDVTADVLAWLGGTENDGWILTAAGGRHEREGRASFGSRESRKPPRLILEVTVDTGRPPIPAAWGLPPSTSLTVRDRKDTTLTYYRNFFAVVFDDTTSGRTIRTFLARNQARVVGGSSFVQSYIIEIPDPGTTADAFAAAWSRLSHQPGVAVVAPQIYSGGAIEVHSRFPTDGPGSARADWFSPTDATLARLAIRLPLAWGCETGQYGGARIRLGISDFVFDTAHVDIAANVAGFHAVPDSLRQIPVPALQTPVFANHGTQMAGLVAAVGDNSTGVAGVMWRADLHFLALSGGGLRPANMVRYYADSVLPHAVAAGVRVLVNAAYFSAGSDSVGDGNVRYLRLAVARFLGGGSGRLLVLSAGNDTARAGAGDIAARRVGHDLALRSAAASMIAAGDTLANRIVIVAATDSTGALEGYSAFVRGGTPMAAPGFRVLTLVPGGGVGPFGGTSAAAALVGGAAGTLWAMDSTLSAASVRDYLIRGSQDSILSPQSGLLTARHPVTGAPETVYQLDAYGVLTLLSRERSGTPICGYPVRAGEDAGTVVLEPRGASPRTITVPGGTAVAGLSVAQGGRLIAVLNDDYGVTPRRTILMDQNGLAVGSPLVGIERRFLERGTADVTYDAARLPSFRITNGGATQVFDPFHGILAGLPGLWQGFGDIAPSGDYAALVALTTGQLSCGSEDIASRYLAALGSPTSQPLGAETYPLWDCPPLPYGSGGNTALAFSHDGRRVVFLATRQGTDATGANLFQTTIVRAETAGGSETHTVTGLYMDTPRFTADDSLFVVGQSDVDGNCTVAFRRADAPWTVVGTPTAGRPGIDCWAYPAPSAPNAPIARAGAARGLAPVGRSLRGLGGFAPAPSALRAVSRPPAPVRAQVN